MLTANKERIIQVYDCVKQFHALEVFSPDLPDPQNLHLLPKLRSYQVKAVKWMLSKELEHSYYETTDPGVSEAPIVLPKGGILAEEMGLGKTVEVLACILSNPRNIIEESKSEIKIETEEVSSSFDKVNKLDSVSSGFSGNEFHVNEEDRIKSEYIKDSKNVQNSLEIRTDGDGVVKFCSAKSNSEVLSNNELSEQKGCDDTRPKRRKQVRFDDDSDSPELKLKNKVKGSNDSKQAISTIDATIDNVIVNYCYNGTAPQPRPKRAAAVKKRNFSYCDDDIDDCYRQPKSRRLDDSVSSKPRGVNRKALQAWYEDCLSEVSVRSERSRRFQQQSSFQCCCIEEIFSDNVVECPKCRTWQHASCVGYDADLANYEYLCFRCWMNEPPVISAGTVIISPEAISQQWVSEIEKHVKKDNLKVLVYEGVRGSGYIQPQDLATYDIVLTTYQVLTRELNYTEPVQRSLRHAKRFFAPTTPLLFVQWWRLCLDEAQMVEGSFCRAAEMAKKFSAVNKWAVTGTPIQKAVNDLIGLMEFLAGNEYPEFLALVTKDWRSLLKMVPRVLWRTQKKDVLEETGVPPQSVETHLLDFSKIEKYFYKCTHTECSQQFVNRITRFHDLNVTLKSLDRKLISSLLNPLLKLRQACLHPQAVRGKFLSFKKTMTMEDLVSQMVANAKQDAELSLRQLVAALNGIGALHIIRAEWIEAAEAYRTVLHLEQEHSDRLKIDSLQRIHAMHNLAEVIDGGHEGIPPTLRDGTLREDVKALELRYLGKREAPVKVSEERVDHHGGAVAALLCGKTVSYSEWWLNLLEWSTDREELLDRLKSSIKQTDERQKNQYNNLFNKLKSLYILRIELAKWLAEVDRVREDVRRWLRTLRTLDTDVMASESLVCHLPQAVSTKNRSRCNLCKAESSLKIYEALLFEERSKEKRKNKRNLPGSSNWEDDKDLAKKEISDLVDVNVNTFESSKKGGFKDSPFERILKALATYGRQNQAPSDWLKDAKDHLILINKLKKEFLDLNLLWRQIFDLVDAKDELNMCKMRLRLPYLGEEEDQEAKKKKSFDSHHIISLYKVEPELHKLTSEKTLHETQLKKRIGTLCYLETLKKEGTSSTICPICRSELVDKWSVLQCGHCLCLECLSLSVKPVMASLPCPQCRQPSNLEDLSYVENDTNEPSTPARPTSTVKSAYSTKVDGVVSSILGLTCNEPDVKILVFSAWEKVLDVLAEAFKENKISFRQMKSSKLKRRQCIKDFKTEAVTVLLLPLRSGAKGLNLVEATHVFLVEPILNPAEELQAVGRVHRIGQTKPTFVHRFIVRETIEERILAAVAASGADQWSDDCITLQQLFDLFSSDLELSLTLSQSEPGPSTVDLDSDSDDQSDSEAEPE